MYIDVLGIITATVFIIQVYYAVANYYDLQLLNTSLEALINQYHKTYREFNIIFAETSLIESRIEKPCFSRI